MSYTQNEIDAYKLFDQKVKKWAKREFKIRTKLPLCGKTIQRYFNDLKYTPAEYASELLDIVKLGVELQMLRNNDKIDKLKKQVETMQTNNVLLTIKYNFYEDLTID